MDTATSSSTLSAQDERTIAALAHVSALLPMIGVIAPIIIWVTQREKSRYVAFQALQAIAFQLTFILIWIAGFACYLGFFFLMFFGSFILGGILQGSNVGPGVAGVFGGMFLIPFAIIFLMIILFFSMIIYGIAAAVLTFQGKDFRYFLIGRWVERYTQRTPA